MEVDTEKIQEEFNLLTETIKKRENDNFRMRDSLKRITHLKKIVEDYSLTLNEEDIFDAILKNAYELFSDADRTLLYLVDTEKQELTLARSKRKETFSQIKAKKGDVFDHWEIGRAHV